MRIRIWMIGLFVALGIAVILGGTAIEGHAFGGPANIHVNLPANLGQSTGCSHEGRNNYQCSGNFVLHVTALSEETGIHFVCNFSGSAESAGFSDQNWLYSVSVGGGSSPAGACSVNKQNDTTWSAYVDTFYSDQGF